MGFGNSNKNTEKHHPFKVENNGLYVVYRDLDGVFDVLCPNLEQPNLLYK